MDGRIVSSLEGGKGLGRGFCSCPARLKDRSVLKSQVFGCAYLSLLTPLFFFFLFLPPLKSPVLLIRREGEDGASSLSYQSYRYRPAPPVD